MLQAIAVVEFVICFIAWSFAFLKARKIAAGQTKIAEAPASWFGIVLQAIGFACTFSYVHPSGYEKSALSLLLSVILAPPSAILGFSAVRHLGMQWRYETAISAGHKLIQSGPYRCLRHPIYTSMFGFLLAGCAALTWWPLTIPAGNPLRSQRGGPCHRAKLRC